MNGVVFSALSLGITEEQFEEIRGECGALGFKSHKFCDFVEGLGCLEGEKSSGLR